MAIFSTDYHKDGSIIAVWKIEEPEEELLKQCAVPQEELAEIRATSNPQRRKERLAVRILLNTIRQQKTYLGHHDNGRPFIRHDAANLSITHTPKFVAVIYHHRLDVGIDMESLNRNFDAVERKILSDSERAYLSPRHRQTQLCMIWCAKEAIYKCISENGIDFAAQIRIEKFRPKKSAILSAVYFNTEKKESFFLLSYKIVEDHILVWLTK
jgi:phosphopantetheinyl transferase